MNLSAARAITADATKGANIKVEWLRACKTRKKLDGVPYTDTIEKAVEAVCRIGIDYDNIGNVKAKRESGELPTENQGIWHGKGEWVDFPYIVRHTVTGKLYFRLYYGTGTAKGKRQFFLNGEAKSFEEVEPALLASEKGEKDGDCFYVKLDDVKSIGWQSKAAATPEVAQEKTEAEMVQEVIAES
jgi:hypothetical protein